MTLSNGKTRTAAAGVGGLLALAGAAVVQLPSAATPADGTGTRTMVQTIELDPATAAREQATGSGLSTRGGPVPGTVPARPTRPFSMLGATWTDPGVRLSGTVEVRTRGRADGRWTGWRRLDAGEPSAADGVTERRTARGSTDPLWVGESDGVQARVLGAAGGPLPRPPAGLRLDLIDPDAAPGDRTAGVAAAPTTEAREPAARAANVPAPNRPVPPVVSRAGWGANDSIVRHAPEYTSEVQALFVHHTATGNGYNCGDSARIIRGIQAYHVRSKGWNDIGYNFLVDRCGTVYEGRGGGITHPVLGAHTKGFNSRSAGIAVIGDHGGAGVPEIVRSAIARVGAYKIGMYGNNPAGVVTLTSAGSGKYPPGARILMNRISGHRDAVPTACPGNGLYRQLAAIRRVAGGAVTGLAVNRLGWAARVGPTFYTRSVIDLGWSAGTSTAFINRFDVFVDDRVVASVPAGHRAVVLRLAPGRHSVQLRAVHLSGRTTLTGRYSVIADRAAPTFAGDPVVNLARGSLRAGVPVTVGWRVSDPGGLRSVALIRPRRVALGTATTRWHTAARPSVASTWAIGATDRAGNAATAAVTRTPVVVSETAAVRSGAWSRPSHPAYVGGAALQSTAPGASLTWSFTGRAGILVFSRTVRSGRVAITVDGRPRGTLDLRSTATSHRQAVWAHNWSSSGAHTVTITVEGSTGRPGVISDGMIYLR